MPDAGRIEGAVTLAGPVPRLQAREVTKDHVACGEKAKPNLSLVLGKEKGIGNAVVHLVGIGTGERFAPASPSLDQRGCDFVPYIQIVPAGVKVAVLNSDSVSHNVHGYDAEGTSLFNVGQPLKGQRVEQEIGAAGAVRLKCDVHPWMFAWMWVAENPYAVLTGRDGHFILTDVPAGTYRLGVWHELFGVREVPVTVPAGGTARVDLTLSLLDPGS